MNCCSFSIENPVVLTKGEYFIFDPGKGKPVEVRRKVAKEFAVSYLKLESDVERVCLIKVDNGVTIVEGIPQCDFLLFSENSFILGELKLNGPRSWKNIYKALKQLKSSLFLYAPFFLSKSNGKNRGNVVYLVIAFGKDSGISSSGGEERRKEKRKIKRLEKFLTRFISNCWHTSHQAKILLVNTYQQKALKIEEKKVRVSKSLNL